MDNIKKFKKLWKLFIKFGKKIRTIDKNVDSENKWVDIDNVIS